MTEWWLFGKATGIPQEELLMISRLEKTVDQCRIAMLQKWIRLEKPTWHKVMSCLFRSGMTSFGWNVAANHSK